MKPAKIIQPEYCQCGCGQLTPISKKTDSTRGAKAGYPTRYCFGHALNSHSAIPILERYEVDINGCWIWTGHKDRHGYGLEQSGGKSKRAHRLFYEHAKGIIPNGLILDHLCKNKSCVNPHHLEAVTEAENVRRGLRAKLTASDAAKIKRLVLDGMPQKDVANRFGVNRVTISNLMTGKSWKDIAPVSAEAMA